MDAALADDGFEAAAGNLMGPWMLEDGVGTCGGG
jgi:hypothetical protein